MIWTSRRTSSMSSWQVSLRLAMDLQASVFFFVLCSASRVVPNWPRPSTLPRW